MQRSLTNDYGKANSIISTNLTIFYTNIYKVGRTLAFTIGGIL
mgnify:CR=1 FL=1